MNTFLLLKTMKNAFFFSRMRFLFVLIFESLFRFLIHENDSYAYGVTRIYVNDTRMIRK